MDNEFLQRQKLDAERDVQVKTTIILSAVEKLNESIIEMKQTLKTIREEMRNINNLRPLKK